MDGTAWLRDVSDKVLLVSSASPVNGRRHVLLKVVLQYLPCLECFGTVLDDFHAGAMERLHNPKLW